MAKELMEIGGFITEGAEIVNHDNTLSGNGTVDSPLGVVPGYNETVLWSGTPTASTNTITVSENFSAFEKIDIYWKSYERRYVTTTFAESNTALPIAVGNVFVLTDGNYEKSMTLWNTSNGTTYTWASTIHGSFTGTQSKSWNSNVVPLKIVGINRIANN
jgi:hypothetical protein